MINCLFNITDPYGLQTRWRLRTTELDFERKYKKCSFNHQGDTLSRLLTGSTTVTHNEDDISSLHIVDENDMNIPSYTIIFGRPTSEYEEQLDDFSELEYEEYEHKLSLQDDCEDEPQFDELLSSQ